MDSQVGRRSLVTLAAIAGLLLPACVASAHPPAPYSLGGHPVHGNYHRWLHSSKVPLVKGKVTLIKRACPGRPKFVGCVFTRHPMRIYLRPGARAPRSVFYHELGHVFDLRVLRHSDRRAFKRIMHLGGRRWWQGTNPPAEQFAEGYCACARYGKRRRAAMRSVYSYRPTRKQHRAVCRLIVRRGDSKKKRRPQPAPKPPPVITESPRPAPPASGNPPSSPPDKGDDGLVDWLLPGALRLF